MRTDIISCASVKVMRSFDYCHFEIILGTSVAVTWSEVDDMRKEAARLADKAVAQYRVAKAVAESRSKAVSEVRFWKANAERIKALTETDRTVEEKAELKTYEDALFRASRDYDYQDDWRDDE